MSRMEEKKQLKKKKRYVKLGLSILFLLLISGILATDYANREMMALFDTGGQLFAYNRQSNLHYIQVFGGEVYIDQELIIENIKGSIEWTKLKSGELIQIVKGLLGKMSG